MTGGVHFDLVKRVLRDIKRSGQAPEEIIQQVGLASLHYPHFYQRWASPRAASCDPQLLK